MSHIGEPVREWEVEEPSIIPEREQQEIERDDEMPIETPVTVPEKEEEKVGV